MRLQSLYFTMLGGLLALGLAWPGVGQVDYRDGRPWDQRASGGPDAQVPGWYYNLGITGVRAELVADEPKALVVRYVFDSSPAAGKVRVDDRIIGVDGRAFEHPHRNGYGMEVFGADGPIGELAAALEACTAEAGTGRLKLMVRRGGEMVEVELRLSKRIGSYSPTYPEQCEKSERVYKYLLTYLADQQQENGSFGDPVVNTFAPLALLASGERRYLPHVERCVRHLIKSIEVSEEQRRLSLMNWTYMCAAIVLSEYYLATGQEWVLPELRKVHALIEKAQYLDMSQINPKAKESHPDSFPRGPMDSHGGWGHNPGFEGYGPISMLTGQGALAYGLMERCGIQTDRARVDAAFGFLERGTAANGYVWYGDEHGGGPTDWADMGRTGAAGIAFALCRYPEAKYRERALLHANVIGEHPQSFPDTHGSPIMGMGYAALAASVDPESFRKLMDANRWWFTMAMCADDGTFYYQPNRDNAGYGADSRMQASAVVAFIYAIPRKSLVITGRQ